MRFSFVVWPAVIGALVLLSGCGGGSTARYVPAEQTSRQALEAALTAWQNGQKPDEVTAGPPAVRVVDSWWSAGAKLSQFQILGEETGDGPTFFSVHLVVKGKSKTTERTVRYVVVGRDPLWVYREEDFKTQTAGM
jgi:hypothetical protein